MYTRWLGHICKLNGARMNSKIVQLKQSRIIHETLKSKVDGNVHLAVSSFQWKSEITNHPAY